MGWTSVGIALALSAVFLEPPSRGKRRLRAGALLTAACFALGWWADASSQRDFETAERSYVALWQQLDQAAADLDGPLSGLQSIGHSERRLWLFRELQAASDRLQGSALGEQGATVLIYDENGEAVAWHGPGLLHEPESLSGDGRFWHQAETAVSLWIVRSLDTETYPWSLVVGVSLPVRPFPFADWPGQTPWTLAPSDQRPPPGIRALGEGISPALWVSEAPDESVAGEPGVNESAASPPGEPWRFGGSLGAWAVLGVWGLVHLLPARREGRASLRLWHRAFFSGVTAMAASGLAWTAGAEPATASAALVATWLPAWTIARRLEDLPGAEGPAEDRDLDGDPPSGPILPALLGAFLFPGFLALSYWAQAITGPLDLSGQHGFGVEANTIRWAVGAAVLAALLAVPKRRGAVSAGLVPAILGLMLAASTHDVPWLTLCLGTAACSAFAIWWSRVGDRAAPANLALVALAASLVASTVWQAAERAVLRQQIQDVYLPLVVPPTEDELNDILLELQSYFETWNPEPNGLAGLVDPPSSSHEDLAFDLWLRSPLPQRDGLSALVLQSVEGETSSFSFGLPLSGVGEPLPGLGRLRVPQAKGWKEMIYGEVDVLLEGRFWGIVRYWFLARPGFRIDIDELGELERTLVRKKPRREMADGLPRGVEYAYFDPSGRALASPWETLPPLPLRFVESAATEGRLTTPDGPSRCWILPDDEGLTVLFLADLSPRQALERVGFVALAGFPMLLAAAWLIWLVPSTRFGLAEMIRSSLRSYSKRLILVYTVLLLVPLVALNLVLLRSFTERLQEEQLRDAQRAMVSARELLVNFLNGLQPGIIIETQVNRDLLEWMSNLVQHQVSVYWGSRIFSSSQEELFTAGLLPRRIPGEIFTRLTLLGHGMELRRRQTGDVAYLEVYAPLDVPGKVSSQQELFVSVPLLEEEEAAKRQLAELQRRALLVTSALFALLMAVGSRLTRGFTRPIVELIAGTRSIARGEPFPEVRPRETELSALAQAIAEMAQQVDESRRGLVREKRFVERVVANITSAVVSLDRESRVAFQNQVAADLLGTEVGDSIDERLAAEERFGPLRSFWLEAQADGRQRTGQVKLRPAGEIVEVREWTLTWLPIPGDADPAALLVVDDDTEVMRGQRLEAWAEMARIIAHEIKNPLTPIQLSAEHLRQVKRAQPDRLDEIFDRCTENILSNVEELRTIASEFSTYSRIPAAQLVSADLGEAMAELSAAYRDAAEQGVTMELVPPEEPLMVRFDEKLLGRAVRNLLENAYRAAAPDGGVVELVVKPEHEQNRSFAVVEVRDSGPGVDPQKLNRIFEPYFSTYESGTGLGLAIVRRIVDQHSGEVEARNRPEGGLAVTIRIPLATPSPDSPSGAR